MAPSRSRLARWWWQLPGFANSVGSSSSSSPSLHHQQQQPPSLLFTATRSPFTMPLRAFHIFILLVFVLSIGTEAAKPDTPTVCTPGFLSCPYFGCLEVVECPKACESVTSETDCKKTHNGKSCNWSQGMCSRQVEDTCTFEDGKCSSDCMFCNTFNCLPMASSCPLTCPQYSTESQCTSAPKYGPISCSWVNNRCSTVDENAKGRDKPSKSASSPGVKPTGVSPPEKAPQAENPDFGDMTSKSSWAGTVGIIIGVIFGLLGLAGIFILFWHRRRERNKRLENEANLHSTHTTLFRPQSFIHALRSVVDNNAKELDAVAPLSPLPPVQQHP